MKVLVYTHAFAPKIGGAETYVMLLAGGLTQQSDGAGRQAAVVTVATPTPAGEMNDSSLPFRVIRRPSLRTLLGLMCNADVVHLAGPCLLPMLLGLALRKRVVVEHHGYQAICPNGLLFYEPTKTVCPGHFMARRYRKCLQCEATTVGWVKSTIELLLAFPRRWACKKVSLNLPISHHVRKRVRLPRTRVVYYGIPDLEQRVKPFREERADPGLSGATFAYVGRLVKEKGLPVLFQAVRQLKSAGRDFRLKIIGDGPERANLEEFAVSLGIDSKVSFTGRLQGDALQSLLQDVSVVVMPTLMEETAGLAVMEQMMRGRIVIASDIGGLSEVVDDAGLKFAPGDAAGLASCLQRVLDDPSLRELLGKKARERALRLFSQDRMVAEHLAVYQPPSAADLQKSVIRGTEPNA